MEGGGGRWKSEKIQGQAGSGESDSAESSGERRKVVELGVREQPRG